MSFHIDVGFLREVTNYTREQNDHEVIEAPMPRMLYLGNVLEFVIERLYYGYLPQQQLIRQCHHRALHVVFELGDELYADHKQLVEQVLTDVSLSQTSCRKGSRQSLVSKKFHIVNVSGVSMKLRISPLSLQMRCSLKQKNHPMEHLPL